MGQMGFPRLNNVSMRVTAQEGISQSALASVPSPRAETKDDPGLKGVAD